jgi:hypothetical protein
MTLLTTKLTTVVLTGPRIVAVSTGRAPGLDVALIPGVTGPETLRAGHSAEAALLLVTELTAELTSLRIAAVGRVALLAATITSLQFEAALDGVTGLATFITDRDATLFDRMTLLSTARASHLAVAVILRVTVLVAVRTVRDSTGSFFVAGLVTTTAGSGGTILDDMSLLLTIVTTLRACDGRRRPKGNRRSSKHLDLSSPRSP